MGRKERRHGTPELDPFGTNDPAWERYEGVSQVRRMAQARAAAASPRVRRLSFVAAMLLLLPLIVGAIVVVVSLLID